uniref:Uncharacterized protein n=1 Tax=Anopheles farauti TaxID=69004 RepID=A0A182QRS3_9DIPT
MADLRSNNIIIGMIAIIAGIAAATAWVDGVPRGERNVRNGTRRDERMGKNSEAHLAWRTTRFAKFGKCAWDVRDRKAGKRPSSDALRRTRVSDGHEEKSALLTLLEEQKFTTGVLRWTWRRLSSHTPGTDVSGAAYSSLTLIAPAGRSRDRGFLDSPRFGSRRDDPPASSSLAMGRLQRQTQADEILESGSPCLGFASPSGMISSLPSAAAAAAAAACKRFVPAVFGFGVPLACFSTTQTLVPLMAPAPFGGR